MCEYGRSHDLALGGLIFTLLLLKTAQLFKSKVLYVVREEPGSLWHPPPPPPTALLSHTARAKIKRPYLNVLSSKSCMFPHFPSPSPSSPFTPPPFDPFPISKGNVSAKNAAVYSQWPFRSLPYLTISTKSLTYHFQFVPWLLNLVELITFW